jgi:hypothetical protein
MADRWDPKRMPRVLFIVAAWGWLVAAAARADPLNSPSCLSAVQALTQAEQATTRRLPAPASSARGTDGARTAPTTVLAARRAVGPVPATAPPRAPMPPEVLTPPLHMTTVCNADGCWTTEGLRLQCQGPVLQGPRGPCLQIGGVLNCP